MAVPAWYEGSAGRALTKVPIRLNGQMTVAFWGQSLRDVDEGRAVTITDEDDICFAAQLAWPLGGDCHDPDEEIGLVDLSVRQGRSSVVRSRWRWTKSFLMDELSKDPDNMTRKYCAVSAQGRGVARDKSDTFNARRDIPTPNLRAWA